MITQRAFHLVDTPQAQFARTAAVPRRARAPAPGRRGVVPALFAAMFAAQAGLLSLAPVLADAARDLGVSTAAAGQLRALGGLAGGVTALGVALLGPRLPLRRALVTGHALLAGGALAGAAAPSLALLAVGQAAVGAAAGMLISAALAASAAWTEPARRARVLAIASLGQPMSWVAGMPLGGLLAELDWRYSVVGVPLAASLVGLAALASRPQRERSATPAARPLRSLPAWAVPELVSHAGWSGVLVFAAALLVESYSLSPAVAGTLLGAAALAALPGNMLARRWLAGHTRELLVVLGLAAAVLTVLFGTLRTGVAASTAIMALLVLVATTRTVAGSAHALRSAGGRRLAAMGVRTATTQFGYLIGAAVGGAALAAGGYELLTMTLASLFALGTVPHVAALLSETSAQPPGRRLAPASS